MEAKEKAIKGGEVSMAEKKRADGIGGEVVITVSSEASAAALNKAPAESSVNGSDFTKSVPASFPSPEIARFSPSPNKPPKGPTAEETLTRRRSFTRSLNSKPKSRFGEQPVPLDANELEEHKLSLRESGANSPYRNSFSKASPNNKSARSIGANPVTPKTPLMASPGPPDEDLDEEIVKKVEQNNKNRNRLKPKVLIKFLILASITGCLVASLTVDRIEKTKIWGLEIWKWCVLVMVIFCGLLITNGFMHLVVFLIEKNFLLRKKVLYFVHGLKKSVQVFIWLSFVLVTWILLFSGVERSKTADKILDGVTWTLASILIGAFLWLLKTLSLKILASSFHMDKFFDRIQESVFHQYVLQTLSGPPLIEEAERVGRSSSTGYLSFRTTKKGKATKEKKVIDMGKVHKMKKEKVSAWTMKILVDAVMNSGLSTISNTLDESAYEEVGEQTDKEITTEIEATFAAIQIFRNVAQPGCSYIDADDLLRFMIKEEVYLVFQLFEGAETGKIEKKALTDWVIKVYKERRALAHALNDTKTAVKQLNKLVTVILIVITIIIWLLLMEIATTKVLLLLSSQLVAAAFLFGNTCKTIFEAIIFVFVMHPFDVGDRCVVDGVQLLVEEMNILTTVFLKLDNEKLYYPNSVLATKPISNYYRSPDMGDNVEFSIGFTTPVKKIAMLKERIQEYLKNNSQHWHPNHNVVVKEIEIVNKIKMALYCNHTMNFQDFAEKNRRRTALVMELKTILEDLDITYSLLPQQVHLRDIGSEPTAATSRQ